MSAQHVGRKEYLYNTWESERKLSEKPFDSESFESYIPNRNWEPDDTRRSEGGKGPVSGAVLPARKIILDEDYGEQLHHSRLSQEISHSA